MDGQGWLGIHRWAGVAGRREGEEEEEWGGKTGEREGEEEERARATGCGAGERTRAPA